MGGDNADDEKKVMSWEDIFLKYKEALIMECVVCDIGSIADVKKVGLPIQIFLIIAYWITTLVMTGYFIWLGYNQGRTSKFIRCLFQIFFRNLYISAAF